MQLVEETRCETFFCLISMIIEWEFRACIRTFFLAVDLRPQQLLRTAFFHYSFDKFRCNVTFSPLMWDQNINSYKFLIQCCPKMLEVEQPISEKQPKFTCHKNTNLQITFYTTIVPISSMIVVKQEQTVTSDVIPFEPC